LMESAQDQKKQTISLTGAAPARQRCRQYQGQEFTAE